MDKRRKKILYLITKSNMGGAQKYVYELAIAATKIHDVTVAFGGTGAKGEKPGKLEHILQAEGIKTVHIKNFMRDVSALTDVKAFFEICSLLRKRCPDVLHVTSSKAGGLGAFAGRLLRVPKIVFTSHGLTCNESWRPFWQKLIITFGTWLTILFTHKSIMISEETFARTQDMPFVEHKMVLVHNGIKKPNYKNRLEARSNIQKHSDTIDNNATWVGTIAELHSNKNLGAVIKALATLQKRGTILHLILIGQGEELNRLTSLAETLNVSSQIHFLGYVDDAATLLPAFDIFVLPSFKEGLPYVLLEAGLASLPVIASNISGVTDIIEDGKNGLLIDPSDVSTIVTALEKLLNNENIRQQYASELSHFVMQNFNHATMLEKTFATYE